MKGRKICSGLNPGITGSLAKALQNKTCHSTCLVKEQEGRELLPQDKTLRSTGFMLLMVVQESLHFCPSLKNRCTSTKNCLNKKEQNMKLSHTGSSETDLNLRKTSPLHNFHKRLWATFFCVWRKLEGKNKKDEEMKTYLYITKQGLKQM